MRSKVQALPEPMLGLQRQAQTTPTAAEIIKAVSLDREKVLQAAQTFISKKKFDKAIAEYQKLIQHDPSDTRTLLKIGDLQSKMDAHAEAVATYERVGKHYADQGFALKAIAVYKQIREIISKRVPHLEDRYGHINPKLADLYAQLGLVSDALAAYDEVATRLQRGGRDRDAIDVFRKIVDLDPTNPLPHLRLAEAYSRIKEVENAVAHFAHAAEILIQLDREDDALKVMERLLHHRPDVRFARQAAELYLARGLADDGMLALAKLQICFQADPKNLDTLGLLARAFEAIGQPSKSLEVQKEMARLAKEQGKLDLYRATVNHLLELAPHDEVVQRLAAASGGRYVNGAVATSDAPISIPDAELEELSEEDGPRGERLRGRRAPSDAPMLEVSEDGPLSLTEDATVDSTFGSGHPQRVLAEAEAFHKFRLYDKAIERLKEGLGQTPSSLSIRSKLRDILLEKGDYPGALEQMMLLANRALEQQDIEGAARELFAVLEMYPAHTSARQMLTDLGYDMGEEHAAQVQGALAEPLPSYDLEEISPDDVLSHPGYELPAGAKVSRSLPAGTESIEDALEEAEFFVSRGLLDDARAVLEEHLSRAPHHPLLRERMAEVQGALAAKRGGGSGTRERPFHQSSPFDPKKCAPSERAFDIGASLDALDALENVQSPAKGELLQVDAEEVFAKFKAGMRTHVSESDSSTHYDLGLAYREMGLLADAAEEFTLAARDPKRECVCHSMVGTILRSQDNVNGAVEAFFRGLHAQEKSESQELGLYYELGDAYEVKGNPSEALYYFRKVSHRKPLYQDPRGDVATRIRLLQEETAPRSSRSQAVKPTEDFDSAFDAITSSGSKP